MKGYISYFRTKLLWFLVTLVAAFVLNFILPRLMPGDPVAAIVARLAQGMSNTTGVQAIYEQYAEQFGTNRPMLEQFFLYMRNVFRGDFGFSFSQYPRTVADVVASSIWWTIGLQFPAIIVGWLLHRSLFGFRLMAIGGNPVALTVVGVLIVLQVLLSYLPMLNTWFGSAPIGVLGWLVPLGFAVAIFLLMEGAKTMLRKRETA